MNLAGAIWDEKISARRIGALAAGLGPDSALGRSWTGGWSTSNEIQAGLLEVLHMLLRVQMRAGGVKRKVPPLQVTRPKGLLHERQQARRRPGTIEEIQQKLDKIASGR